MSDIHCDECGQAKCGLIHVGDYVLCAECVNGKFAALTAERDRWKERAGELETTIQDVAAELARRASAADQEMIAERGVSNSMREKYWCGFSIAYEDARNLLIPLFHPQPPADTQTGPESHVEDAKRIVAAMPDWKRRALGDQASAESQTFPSADERNV